MPPAALQAVLLDMDGVIVDSEHQWRLTEGPFFHRVAPAWRDEYHHRIVGLGVIELHGLLVKEYGCRESQKSFLADCEDLAQEVYGRRVSLTSDLLDFIAQVRAAGLSLGLASSAPRRWIDIVLSRFALKEFFSAVVSGDEVPGRTKPEPDVYLLAARRLNVAPASCAAIEDSALGVRAAKSAGMFCAAFRNGFNDGQDLTLADAQFHSFAELEAILTFGADSRLA